MKAYESNQVTTTLCLVMFLLTTVGSPIAFGDDAAGATQPAVQGGMKPPPSPMIAHVHLGGQVTETPVSDPFGFMGGQVTSLKRLIRTLRRGQDNDRVAAVIVTFGQVAMGLGQREEIRKALMQIKRAGKPVYVFAEGMSTATYATFAVASELTMAPQTTVWLTGYYGETLYVKELLDKIGIGADFMQMEQYKSAAEMFTRTGPSDPARENYNWLFDSLYDTTVDMIAEARGLSAERVQALIDDGPYLADAALEARLIDSVKPREQFIADVKMAVESKHGGAAWINNRYGDDVKPQLNFANPFMIFS